MVPAPPRARRRFDTLEQEVFLRLWRAYDRLHSIEEAFFKEHGLSPQQYNLLRLMRAAHPERVATLTLAQRLVSRAPDVTRMIDKLEADGLVERHRTDADRRTVLIGISASGLRLLDEISEPLQQCHRRQLGHLSAARLRQLAQLLRDVAIPHEQPHSDWIR
jgi:DNA-binding MarR family transcriptional regulator